MLCLLIIIEITRFRKNKCGFYEEFLKNNIIYCDPIRGYDPTTACGMKKHNMMGHHNRNHGRKMIELNIDFKAKGFFIESHHLFVIYCDS